MHICLKSGSSAFESPAVFRKRIPLLPLYWEDSGYRATKLQVHCRASMRIGFERNRITASNSLCSEISVKKTKSCTYASYCWFSAWMCLADYTVLQDNFVQLPSLFSAQAIWCPIRKCLVIPQWCLISFKPGRLNYVRFPYQKQTITFFDIFCYLERNILQKRKYIFLPSCLVLIGRKAFSLSLMRTLFFHLLFIDLKWVVCQEIAASVSYGPTFPEVEKYSLHHSK